MTPCEFLFFMMNCHWFCSKSRWQWLPTLNFGQSYNNEKYVKHCPWTLYVSGFADGSQLFIIVWPIFLFRSQNNEQKQTICIRYWRGESRFHSFSLKHNRFVAVCFHEWTICTYKWIWSSWTNKEEWSRKQTFTIETFRIGLLSHSSSWKKQKDKKQKCTEWQTCLELKISEPRSNVFDCPSLQIQFIFNPIKVHPNNKFVPAENKRPLITRLVLSFKYI